MCYSHMTKNGNNHTQNYVKYIKTGVNRTNKRLHVSLFFSFFLNTGLQNFTVAEVWSAASRRGGAGGSGGSAKLRHKVRRNQVNQ